MVCATRVEPLHLTYWEQGKILQELPSLNDIRGVVETSIKQLRNDHRRYLNPTPYKVSVSEALYNFLHELWLKSAPIGVLH
ncbi:unnamed protein product [Caenorhabditis auriculariae]|uniref:nicotinate phosphoribosyltransferase n=1 Tax=Caenorhabditis auriculariae TaxID=2777116 RepID=A0A8S1HD19_9PELO|nr:unnamed protein product [Caenorhabditis auriculariae]